MLEVLQKVLSNQSISLKFEVMNEILHEFQKPTVDQACALYLQSTFLRQKIRSCLMQSHKC